MKWLDRTTQGIFNGYLRNIVIKKTIEKLSISIYGNSTYSCILTYGEVQILCKK